MQPIEKERNRETKVQIQFGRERNSEEIEPWHHRSENCCRWSKHRSHQSHCLWSSYVPLLYPLPCVWLPRKHIGVLGFCTTLILVFFWFNFMKWFLQNLCQFWYKDTLWTFFLFFCLFNKLKLVRCFCTAWSWSNFFFKLHFITTHFVCQMMHWIIKHALQNFGCKSKTKYTDYLPRTKAYLFSKKIKEIWNQRLPVCWENHRKKARKNKTQNPRLVTCSTNGGCQTAGPRTPKVQILSPLNFSISVATGNFNFHMTVTDVS